MTAVRPLVPVSPPRRAAGPESAPQNILLVDDHRPTLLALEAVLSRLGQKIVKAGSGAEALQAVLHTDFAVILLDVQMPGISGFEAANLIRQRDKSAQTPIIFLTAGAQDEVDVLKGYTLGAVDYLFKPIVPEVLSSKVQVFVELARKNAQLLALSRSFEAQAKLLAAANKELESFSSSVSHDLRAPLRSITGFSELLLESNEDKLDETSRGYLERIRKAGQRMGELIDDLLSLARVTRSDLHREHIDLVPVAREIIADLVSAEPGRHVDLVLPDTAFANADPRLIRVVLENLISNAWKFTQRADKARIELGILSRPKQQPVYFVRDDGAGFDPAQIGRLFRPFQRLHTSSEFAGTGIGLAIVERIVSRHGGRVWADSNPGQGAKFSFTLAPDEVT